MFVIEHVLKGWRLQLEERCSCARALSPEPSGYPLRRPAMRLAQVTPTRLVFHMTPQETDTYEPPAANPQGARGGNQSGSSGATRALHGTAWAVSVLIALMLTLLLEALDQTVVGTALPKIIGELNGFSLYTWVATAYLLASATVIPIVGKLSDQFGRKWFFIVGVVIFLLGSALSGAAQTIQQLIAFRALQGLGAGIGISLVFTVVGDIFPPAERARWQGIFGAVYGLSSVFGPTLGGWLTDHGPLVGTSSPMHRAGAGSSTSTCRLASSRWWRCWSTCRRNLSARTSRYARLGGHPPH